jgi:serine/threonine-protein kinase HipA
MGRKAKTQQLKVFLNGALTGVLSKDPRGALAFQYDTQWLLEGFAISHSLPLREDAYHGDLVTRYFENLLPDNEEVKKKIAGFVGAESTKAFDLLSRIGRDCVGALTFVEGEAPNLFELTYKSISEKAIAQKLRNVHASSPLGLDDQGLRISIAGFQEKTALLKIQDKWCLPMNTTPTTHILKLPIGALQMNVHFDDSVDNEWSCLFILRKLGFNVCEALIERFEDQRVLVVKRFDRVWKKRNGKDILLRLPQEDLCQAFGLSSHVKYQSEGGPSIEKINRFLEGSSVITDREHFFKSIMAFDLLFAIDGHAKNFSVFFTQDGFRLTPLYDVMSGYFLTQLSKNPVHMTKLKLAMSVGKSSHYRFEKIFKSHYAQTADRCGWNAFTFEKMVSDLKKAVENLSYQTKELDPDLNTGVLDLMIEKMQIRAKRILV